MHDQDMGFVNRLDVPLLVPDVGRRFFLEVADLTEGRLEDDTTAKPAHNRYLNVHANPTALRENNAEDIGTVVAAQVYVTINVGDGQERITRRARAPVDPANHSFRRKFHLVIFAMKIFFYILESSIVGCMSFIRDPRGLKLSREKKEQNDIPFKITILSTTSSSQVNNFPQVFPI